MNSIIKWIRFFALGLAFYMVLFLFLLSAMAAAFGKAEVTEFMQHTIVAYISVDAPLLVIGLELAYLIIFKKK